MKILKIALVSIAVLIVVVIIGAVIFIKTFDIERYRPQIISEASKALARGVDFEKAKLGISLFQGISLKISGFAISEDPAFGTEKFFTVKEVSAGVDVLGYLLRQKISITSILIDSPHVVIIRQKDGSINAQTIAKPIDAGKEIVKSTPVAAAAAIPAFFISSIKSVNGTVVYLDNSFEPALRLETSKLDFTLNNVSLSGVFPFTVEAAVLSAKQNIRIEGKARFDLKTNEITLTDLKGATELSNIILSQIPVVFPMAKGAVLPASLNGSLNLAMDKLTAGPKGLGGLSADAVLANSTMKFKELASPIQDIKIKAKVTEKNVFFNQVSAAIGSGAISASASIEDYLGKQEYSVSADIKDLKLRELLVQDNSPAKMEGITSGKVNIKGAGFTPEALKSTLSGNADISVVKAQLKDINILRTVLDKVAAIPGLSQKIEGALPEKYKQKLTQKDTVLSDIKLPVLIENGRALLKDVFLSADEFIFKGSGSAGLGGDYALEGAFLIPADLSSAMISSVSELQYLLNEEKQIYIPLKIHGKAGDVKFNVDAQYIVEKLVSSQAKQQIFKALDKAMGNKEPSAEQQGGAAQPGSGEKSSTEEAVGNLLDSLFKKK